jgi:hypothetical protein
MAMVKSTRLPWCAPILAAALAACGPPPEAATAPPPSAAPPPVDEAAARRAAEVALASLAKRKFSTLGCAVEDMRVLPEAEAQKGAPPGERCSILVARRADKTWLVVVRSASQTASPKALVTVSPGGEGVTHIDYQP